MWSDAIAAWMTYAPRPCSAKARSSASRPRVIFAASLEAGLAARVVEQHQRLEAVYVGLVGHQFDERGAQPESLSGEIDAAAVPLVEDQVDDREHGSQPLGQQVPGRDTERDARIPDLSLRPRESPLHGLFGNQKGAGDLLRAQPAERAQGQGDLGLERE
jgi:hypothetical protein